MQVIDPSIENTWEYMRMYPITAGSREKEVEGALAVISEGERREGSVFPYQSVRQSSC